MNVKKLTDMPYAQANVILSEDGSISLISYTTKVAHITPDGWLTINGLYSMTTRRHISAFVQEYANIPYQTAKALYENHFQLNIHTGEVQDIIQVA